jgi:predicted esterase
MFRHVIVLLLVASSAMAATPPSIRARAGEFTEGIVCATDAGQTYTLYLPSSFSRDRKAPVLLIFDPRGRSRSAAELFRAAADTHGWILVSSDNTRSDEAWRPNVEALEALWPELDRLPVDRRRVYAAGFSGTVAVATLLATTTGQVAGVLACGGRFFPDQLEELEAPVFATAGFGDFNYDETTRIAEKLVDAGKDARLRYFEGFHSWMPAEVAAEAVGWFELIAMRDGLREADPALVADVLADDLQRVGELSERGDVVAAERLLREMVTSYDGLVDTGPLDKRAAALAASPGFDKLRRGERRAANAFRRCRDGSNEGLQSLRTRPQPPSSGVLASELGLERLMRQAAKGGAEGRAAAQCLASIYSSVSFYLPREALAEGRYQSAATSYELAVMIRDQNPIVWYNLACARARLGKGAFAVEALEQAIEHGFSNFELLATDPDLDSLRDREDFQTLVNAYSLP